MIRNSKRIRPTLQPTDHHIATLGCTAGAGAGAGVVGAVVVVVVVVVVGGGAGGGAGGGGGGASVGVAGIDWGGDRPAHCRGVLNGGRSARCCFAVGGGAVQGGDRDGVRLR